MSAAPSTWAKTTMSAGASGSEASAGRCPTAMRPPLMATAATSSRLVATPLLASGAQDATESGSVTIATSFMGSLPS